MLLVLCFEAFAHVNWSRRVCPVAGAERGGAHDGNALGFDAAPSKLDPQEAPRGGDAPAMASPNGHAGRGPAHGAPREPDQALGAPTGALVHAAACDEVMHAGECGGMAVAHVSDSLGCEGCGVQGCCQRGAAAHQAGGLAGEHGCVCAAPAVSSGDDTTCGDPVAMQQGVMQGLQGLSQGAAPGAATPAPFAASVGLGLGYALGAGMAAAVLDSQRGSNSPKRGSGERHKNPGNPAGQGAGSGETGSGSGAGRNSFNRGSPRVDCPNPNPSCEEALAASQQRAEGVPPPPLFGTQPASLAPAGASQPHGSQGANGNPLGAYPQPAPGSRAGALQPPPAVPVLPNANPGGRPMVRLDQYERPAPLPAPHVSTSQPTPGGSGTGSPIGDPGPGQSEGPRGLDCSAGGAAALGARPAGDAGGSSGQGMAGYGVAGGTLERRGSAAQRATWGVAVSALVGIAGRAGVHADHPAADPRPTLPAEQPASAAQLAVQPAAGVTARPDGAAEDGPAAAAGRQPPGDGDAAGVARKAERPCLGGEAEAGEGSQRSRSHSQGFATACGGSSGGWHAEAGPGSGSGLARSAERAAADGEGQLRLSLELSSSEEQMCGQRETPRAPTPGAHCLLINPQEQCGIYRCIEMPSLSSMSPVSLGGPLGSWHYPWHACRQAASTASLQLPSQVAAKADHIARCLSQHMPCAMQGRSMGRRRARRRTRRPRGPAARPGTRPPLTPGRPPAAPAHTAPNACGCPAAAQG